MEHSDLFRKESMDRIQSPEQLNDYLRITNPSIWMVLCAVIVLLAGLLVWGSFASIDSHADGVAQVEDGVMTVWFESGQFQNVSSGMKVTVGNSESYIISVGWDESGRFFALADTALSDGTYDARVVFRQTQVMKLLFN
ncbi:MAG: hypothetical protein IKQ10_11700 [Oscillospiraceae bacterium]|nr:hypothetical protein [Oscillospiraceae bacterium]